MAKKSRKDRKARKQSDADAATKSAVASGVEVIEGKVTNVKVKATKDGFVHNTYRHADEVFEIPIQKGDKLPSWVKEVKEDGSEKKASAKAGKKSGKKSKKARAEAAEAKTEVKEEKEEE